MTNPYLDMLAPGAAANADAADPTKNEYLGMLQGAADQRRQALAGSLNQSVATNPDEFSAKRKVAGYLGYPVAALDAIPGLADQAKVRQVQTDTAGTPVLQQRYTDADFAKLAHDDSFTLAGIETAIAKAARYVMGADTGGGLAGDVRFGGNALAAGAAGLGRGAAEIAALPFNAAGLDTVTSIGGNPLQRLAEGFGDAARSARGRMDAEPIAPDAGTVRKGIRSGVSSAVGSLSFVPLAFMGPGGIAAALAGMVGVAGGTTYQGDREKGVPVGTAGLHAAADMVAEYTTEKYLGAAGLLQRITAGSAAGKLAMYEITREVPGEIAATV